MRAKPIIATGWGRVLRAREDSFRPERISALRAEFEAAPAPAFGNRRSYGDAPLNDGGRSYDMTRLDRLLSFDPATGELEAEAGVTLGDILRHFAPLGWMPAVLPGTGHVTLGGAIAADVHGKNHQWAGSFGQHLLSVDLLTPQGLRQVPPADRDVFRATLGGMGQTGLILSARLRLAPCPGGMVEVTERRMRDLSAFLAAFEQSNSPYSVGWMDLSADGPARGRGILEEATILPASGFARTTTRWRVPRDAPGKLLSPAAVRLFNRAYFNRIPRAGRSRRRPLPAFFFPLDRVAQWNRLYGKAGFHQFQCAVPRDAADALDGMIQNIADHGAASPLAVLKRLGPGRAGFLSFPMEGYTLAVDLPQRADTRALLDRLHDRTAEAGGRVYLAKDACLAPRRLGAMYPELDHYRRVIAQCDPDGAMQTDLSRRLNLRGMP
ncbi:FAD-binding oxidoreductase [Brevirhabdus sp.]|uniref:FAD-binding oxidoreductase n=1 Tax=Brevirhabdus sp. TaxID=2004514 RepID=UPI00405898D5